MGWLSEAAIFSLINARASSIRSFSEIWSITPISKAFLALIGAPEIIIFNAWAGPTTLGNLWVPPAPGKRPKFTSGRPKIETFVDIL